MYGNIPKGKMDMERRITPWVMAKIMMLIAESEEAESAERKYQREIKKQTKIARLIN